VAFAAVYTLNGVRWIRRHTLSAVR